MIRSILLHIMYAFLIIYMKILLLGCMIYTAYLTAKKERLIKKLND